MSHKLTELARIIRSKNAKCYLLTFDILFDNPENYNLVKNSQVINKELISKLYNVKQDLIEIYFFDAALGIKCTIPRAIPSGAFGDTDICGSQQGALLYNIEI